MAPRYFLINFFQFLVSVAPIFALLISRIKLNGRRWFFLSEITISVMAFLLFINVLNWYPPFELSLYAGFLMAYLGLFSSKFGYEQFNKCLALSIFLTFVATEAWEIAAFIYGYLGVYGNFVLPIIHPLHHIYVIVCFLLAAKISQLQFTKLNVTILVASLLCSFLFFDPIAIFPLVKGGRNPQFIIMRIITFSAFAVIFYFWSDKKE